MNFKKINFLTALAMVFLMAACSEQSKDTAEQTEAADEIETKIIIEAASYTDASDSTQSEEGPLKEGEGLAYELPVTVPGRYQVSFYGSASQDAQVWIEDYIDNTDGRTYDITGKMTLEVGSSVTTVDGSPLNEGVHKVKLHAHSQDVEVDRVEFTLMVAHQNTPKNFTQETGEGEWQIAWSDEFDGSEIDTSKWTYDIGDWGWGNNELQYYTANRKENARLESGNLVIEAIKDENGKWTSARLTTRGKESFTYGKIEFRAIVPREKGNWAAAWTLGDSYRDEISWPYCGEIDILESVGYEVDNETGDGIAHVTVHTPAYYFKINNQISNVKNIPNIAGEFHTYSVEWTPTEVRGFVDGEDYYLYDKIADEKEWPFGQAQNIIINLAMGGGWGGAQGMDTTVTSQKFILDYVRVYGKQ
jgi:beta-glucanase (GH16 family)